MNNTDRNEVLGNVSKAISATVREAGYTGAVVALVEIIDDIPVVQTVLMGRRGTVEDHVLRPIHEMIVAYLEGFQDLLQKTDYQPDNPTP